MNSRFRFEISEFETSQPSNIDRTTFFFCRKTDTYAGYLKDHAETEFHARNDWKWKVSPVFGHNIIACESSQRENGPCNHSRAMTKEYERNGV